MRAADGPWFSCRSAMTTIPERRDDLGGVVGRTVVDDDDLDVVVALRLDAPHRVGQEAAHLEHGNDDADPTGDRAGHDSINSAIVRTTPPRSVPASRR